jgi:carbon-monoxide dehydrogenase small subunit
VTRVAVLLTVNGKSWELEVEPRWTLADVLRSNCGLTGTHLGCEQGICGACTVLLDGDPVRACLLYAVQCQDSRIETIEGLTSSGAVSELQSAFSKHHGLQCGFCTPGFIVLAAGILERDPEIGDDDLIDALSSNLCRCTGYHGIIEAVKSVRDGHKAEV